MIFVILLIITITGCFNKRKELIGSYIYAIEDSVCYDEACITITDFSGGECYMIKNRNCDSNEKYSVTIKAGNKEYTLYTDDGYKKINEIGKYAFAKIESGSLIIGLAE